MAGKYCHLYLGHIHADPILCPSVTFIMFFKTLGTCLHFLPQSCPFLGTSASSWVPQPGPELPNVLTYSFPGLYTFMYFVMQP